MSSIFQKRTFIFPYISKDQALPVSARQPTPTPVANDSGSKEGGLRRRLSSSAARQISSSSSSSMLWGFRRSRSESSILRDLGSTGSAIRKWWEWGWGWILSRKPSFAQDLEMNEHEVSMLGSQHKGSWRHLLYKARSQIRKIMGSDRNVGLPQTCRYDSFAYSQNFDDSPNRPR